MTAASVRDALAELVAAELVRKIPLLRTEWNLDAARLPDVDIVKSGEKADGVLDSRGRSWIEVVTPRLARNTGRIDLDAGRPVHRLRYAARIYVWVLAATWDLAIAGRDHLGAATRLCLLEYPTLTLAGGDTGYLVREDTLTEDAGEPFRMNRRGGNAGSSRVWAPMVLAFEVDSHESTAAGSTRPPIGTADQFVITPDVVGPTTPFPEE